MTVQEQLDRIAFLEKENAEQKALIANSSNGVRAITFDIGPKGGVMARGVNSRFPAMQGFVGQIVAFFGKLDDPKDFGYVPKYKAFVLKCQKAGYLATKDSPKDYTADELRAIRTKLGIKQKAAV